MKKFGFKKNKGDDEPNKQALFGAASSKAQQTNPYAAMGAGGNDPYAPKSQSPAPPAYDGGMDGYRRDKSPVPPGGYGAPAPTGGRYGSSGISDSGSRYGNTGPSYSDQGGYGSNRFGDEQQQQGGYGSGRFGSSGIQEGLQSRRPGGYGGMDTEETQKAQGALFGDAPNRYQTHSDPPKEDEASSAAGGYGSTPGGYGGGSGGYGNGGDSQGYGSYGDRELTQEEQEQEDINATKQEIRFVKQQDVSSTRNALRLADQAYQTGASTLERLGAQGERIHNTERNLDLASVQNRVASEKARELKTLNRSMFAVHVANPFTSNKRREDRENKIMETHRTEREQRDTSRAQAYSSTARQDQYARDLRGQPQKQTNKASLADRSKYQFEADSEDEDMENEIDNNLDMLHGATGKLKHLAVAMGQEVDEQNKHIDRITGKVDRVDDEIALNRARLDRIK